jgi:polyphosphate kinase
VIDSTGLIGIGDLAGVVEEDRPDLKFEPYSPRLPRTHPRT